MKVFLIILLFIYLCSYPSQIAQDMQDNSMQYMECISGGDSFHLDN